MSEPFFCNFLTYSNKPSFETVRSAFVQSFTSTQSFNSGTKMRFFCKFGKKRRFVLIFEWETLLPTIGRFPVNSQTLDMIFIFKILIFKKLGSKRFCFEPFILRCGLVRIRTLNLLIRSQMLYPVELRNHKLRFAVAKIKQYFFSPSSFQKFSIKKIFFPFSIALKFLYVNKTLKFFLKHVTSILFCVLMPTSKQLIFTSDKPIFKENNLHSLSYLNNFAMFWIFYFPKNGCYN